MRDSINGLRGMTRAVGFEIVGEDGFVGWKVGAFLADLDVRAGDGFVGSTVLGRCAFLVTGDSPIVSFLTCDTPFVCRCVHYCFTFFQSVNSALKTRRPRFQLARLLRWRSTSPQAHSDVSNLSLFERYIPTDVDAASVP